MRIRAFAALLALGAAALCFACSRGSGGSASAAPPEVPVSARVELHPQIVLDHPKAELEDRVALAAARWARSAGPSRLPVGPENRLTIAIRVDLTVDSKRLVIEEALRLRQSRQWPLEVNRTQEVPVTSAGVDLSAALITATEAALALLSEMSGLFALDDAGLVAVVRRAEAPVDLRSLAVRILQDRQARGSVSDLLAVLPGSPEPLRLTLIDAMGTLGAPGDVPPLLRAIDARKNDEVARALRSVALVGGQDAREFADWMAVGHPDERVRSTAAEARAQLRDQNPLALLPGETPPPSR
jgi:HEAT repeat protein